MLKAVESSLEFVLSCGGGTWLVKVVAHTEQSRAFWMLSSFELFTM